MTKSPTSIPRRGLAEHGFLFTPEKPNGGAVLFAHGYGEDSTAYHELAEACSEIGMTCLAVDLLGYGQSEGKQQDLRVSDHVNGLMDAYSHLAAQPGVERDRIGSVARSFGAYLTVLLSHKRTFSSLLLHEPALYHDSLRDMPQHVFLTSSALNMKPDQDNFTLGVIHDFSGRVLLVSSENDGTVRSDTIEAYSRAISDGDHIHMVGPEPELGEPQPLAFNNVVLNWALEI